MLVICIVALLILVLVFRVEYPSLFLQPVPSNAINLSSCAVLTQNNAYYVLNQTIAVTLSPCITVNANNVVIDGQHSHLITNTNVLSFTAIQINGNNVTAKRLNITSITSGTARMINAIVSFGNDTSVLNNTINRTTNTGVLMNKVFNPKILHNTITSLKPSAAVSNQAGIHLTEVIGANVSNNFIYNSTNPVVLSAVNNSFVSNNFIQYLGRSDDSNIGIQLTGSQNNDVAFNIVRDMNYSIYIASADRNVIRNNELHNSYLDSIVVMLSNNTNFTNNIIFDSGRNGIGFITVPSVPITAWLNDVLVLNTNPSYYDLNANYPFFSTYGAVSLYLKNGYIDTYKFNNTYLTFVNPRNATLSFNSPFFDVSGGNLTSDVKLDYNFAEVNSVSNPNLNRSATINLYGLPTTISNAIIHRNGVQCPLNICYNLTRLEAGNVTFNVTGWTNYSINWTGMATQPQPAAQTMSISEPDPNEQYTTAAFPVNFRVTLSTVNGSVKFSFDNGVTNTTMVNDTNALQFDYVQNSLDPGNYTFTAFSNFTNGTRIKDSVNFSVINTTGSSTSGPTGGSNSGSSSGSGSRSSSGTGSSGTPTIGGTTGLPTNGTFGTTSGTGSTQTLTGSQSSSTAFRSMIFWLIVAVLSIMIVILTILVFKAVKRRKTALSSSMSVSSPVNTGGLISNLR